ncbi:ABC transporter ATP-binding protein [Actinomadura madurae]|uniref:ABC transporter ATP-binding protein n=1 Tax=Actinomadura madurae TaxID=1993 RepID=UPI0039996B07
MNSTKSTLSRSGSHEAGQDGQVALRTVVKRYGDEVAVDHLSLDVRPGELLTLLGPSGCGKTTTLNMIAGFAEPDAGAVLMNGSRVDHLPPNKRPSAMVFQQYALFPHMTVADNVGFGLRMRKVGRAERARRIADALALVGLAGMGGRFPRQLSGGQQQRVALARATVVEPAVLLLDEPLSNLDLKLREQLRLEIRRLQQKVGITTVFVTHDQTEALVVSDRIAVMNAGRIEQLGPPAEIYARPVNTFVAGFVGQSNILAADVAGPAGPSLMVRLEDGQALSVTDPREEAEAGERVNVLIRPESLTVHAGDTVTGDAAGEAAARISRLRGSVTEVQYLGASANVVVDLPGAGRLTAAVSGGPATSLPSPGDRVTVTAPAGECLVLAD